MKNLFVIILLSLFFSFLAQKPKEINSLRLLDEKKNQTILLGFANYNQKLKSNNELSLTFFTYFLLKDWDIVFDKNNIKEELNESFIIKTNITDQNNKYWEKSFNCSSLEPIDYKSYKYQLALFSCENNYTESALPKQIKIITNLTNDGLGLNINETSSFAEAYKNDLMSLKDFTIENYLILENSTLIERKENYFKIRAKEIRAKAKLKSKKIQLIMSNDGDKKIINCEGKYDYDDNDEKYYFLEPTGINPPISGPLQYAIAIIPKTNKAMILDFGQNTGNTTISSEKPFYRKSKGGLSTGGIVAVLIPSIIVLLGVAGLVYFLGIKRSPQTHIANNNTIGVVSSENIINK